MAQLSFSALEGREVIEKTRKAEFLNKINDVVPWQLLAALVEPHYPKAPQGSGRLPYALETMLRIFILQHCYALSDPQTEQELIDSISMRKFAKLGGLDKPTPDETTICKFRKLINDHGLGEQIFRIFNEYLETKGVGSIKQGTIVDATIINSACSLKNKQKARDPEMKHTCKGKQYYFGAKAHIGVDAETGLVHSMKLTGANVADVTVVDHLVRKEDKYVQADAGYVGMEQHLTKKGRTLLIAMRPGKRRLLDKHSEAAKLEFKKSQIRAKVEHAFHWIKCVFGLRKLRYRGLFKNEQMLFVMFGLVNLCKSSQSLIKLRA